jgi:hypothetical protein
MWTYLYVALAAVVGFSLLLMMLNRRFAFLGQAPADYVDASRPIDLRRDMSGPILCDGVIYGPLGRVVSRFTGHFEARWNGNEGIMLERFLYDSGQEQTREWILTIDEDGQIRARADDLVGEGWGQQMGSAAHLRYRIRLEEDAGGYVLNVRDWMYLTPNGTIVNRSQFRKYGLKVAELVATMRRKDAM